jgi:hypothetical protein
MEEDVHFQCFRFRVAEGLYPLKAHKAIAPMSNIGKYHEKKPNQALKR